MGKAINFLFKNWVYLFFAFMAFLYFNGKRQRKKMDANHRYTAGVVESTYFIPKSGRNAKALFTVNGQEYAAHADADLFVDKPLIGRRFVVEFYPPDPDRMPVLYLDSPVPGSVTDVPAEGWLTPPFDVSASVLASNSN